MALKGVKLEEIKAAHSHIMGLGQCRNFLRSRGIVAKTSSDTAGAAREVRDIGDPTQAAIAPRLAAEVYGLDILAENIEDAAHNTTRFVIMSRNAQQPGGATDPTPGPATRKVMGDRSPASVLNGDPDRAGGDEAVAIGGDDGDDGALLGQRGPLALQLSAHSHAVDYELASRAKVRQRARDAGDDQGDQPVTDGREQRGVLLAIDLD